MSKPGPQKIPTSVAASLLSQSTIEAIVPDSADVDTLSLLVDDDASDSNADASLRSTTSRIPERQTLYLDELITVHVILKVPFVPEHAFKAFLERLSIKLEAYAVSPPSKADSQRNPRQPPGQQSVKELVDSCIVDSGNDPMVAVGTETKQESPAGAASDDSETVKRYIYILWKEELHISRSRIRTRDLSVYLSATCSLQPSSASTTDDILTTGETSSPNLFAALAADPSFDGAAPVLTAARLAKHAPAGMLERDTARPIKNAQRSLMRALPSIVTRLRCTRVGGSPNTARMLAAVDVETSAALRLATATLTTAELALTDGAATPVAPVALPRRTAAGDITTLLYELAPSATTPRRAVPGAPAAVAPTPTPAAHALSFQLLATATDPGPGDRARRISTQWRTAVDLSGLHDPPGSAALQRVPTSKRAAAKRTTALTPSVTLAVGAPAPRMAPRAAARWTVQLSNRGGAGARTQRLRVQPLLDAGDGDGVLLPLTAHADTGPLRPGGSATVALRFGAPVRPGAARCRGLRIVDLDGVEALAAAKNAAARGEEGRGFRGRAWVDVPGWMLPEVVVAEGSEKDEDEDSIQR